MNLLAQKLDPGWVKVDGLRVLVSRTRPPDYIFYLDVDAQFVRSDVRLEELVDRSEQWSVYAMNHVLSALSQSSALMIRGDNYGRRFVMDWWDRRLTCPNQNREQGAWQDTIAINHMMNKFQNLTLSRYTCSALCGKKNGGFNGCYNNWMEENKFGFDWPNSHPKIFFYPFRNVFHGAPVAGFTFNPNKHAAKQYFRVPLKERQSGGPWMPLSVHPCKDYVGKSGSSFLDIRAQINASIFFDVGHSAGTNLGKGRTMHREICRPRRVDNASGFKNLTDGLASLVFTSAGLMHQARWNNIWF